MLNSDEGGRVFRTKDREIENGRSSIFIDKNLQLAETAIYRDGTESKDIVVVSASRAISTFRARHFSPFRNTLRQWYKYPDRLKVIVTLRRRRIPAKKKEDERFDSHVA